ncbi:TPA: hypothetical protein ACMFQU_006481 [Pseudomonas aeruginosa]|uniref:hypothetical protein n=1 Tax=Pseudomonas TaxID=286 RepID=UPI0004F2CE79|nr:MULTISPECIES: hypothetical protein [Pseudomonas]EKV0189043.1 hypothetical protein [Pseudomonas aeruginosa]EKX5088918.1 hypothetical protein [Pseudomonas aeruginosa]EMB9912240.1 hypothetical protein [Pseudomonas aeruginosa]KSJ76703.1 hypothetical protein APA02_24515 [Pseudomonas aeruginosa]KSL57049.1 hypothetical protein APA47_12995 [Pseudomonas aeruginosa]
MREEFEAWATKHRMPIHRDGVVTDYAARCTDECWQAWKASRAALKVELPEKIGPHNMVGRHVLPEAAGYDDAIDDCREALQQAGIELKP